MAATALANRIASGGSAPSPSSKAKAPCQTSPRPAYRRCDPAKAGSDPDAVPRQNTPLAPSVTQTKASGLRSHVRQRLVEIVMPAQSRSPWAENARWLARYNAASASGSALRIEHAGQTALACCPHQCRGAVRPARVGQRRIESGRAAPPSATRHPSADRDREIDDLTLAARSMNTDENEDRRPSNRRTIAQSTPSASSPATIMSATWSSRAGSPASHARQAGQSPQPRWRAPPPPVISAPFARYFSARRGISSRKKTKSTTATPVVTIFVIARSQSQAHFRQRQIVLPGMEHIKSYIRHKMECTAPVIVEKAEAQAVASINRQSARHRCRPPQPPFGFRSGH
jgi:hypothetical protein